jgi:hypothetical protein
MMTKLGIIVVPFFSLFRKINRGADSEAATSQKKATHVVIEKRDPTRSRSGIDQRTPMEKVK